MPSWVEVIHTIADVISHAELSDRKRAVVVYSSYSASINDPSLWINRCPEESVESFSVSSF